MLNAKDPRAINTIDRILKCAVHLNYRVAQVRASHRKHFLVVHDCIEQATQSRRRAGLSEHYSLLVTRVRFHPVFADQLPVAWRDR